MQECYRIAAFPDSAAETVRRQPGDRQSRSTECTTEGARPDALNACRGPCWHLCCLIRAACGRAEQFDTSRSSRTVSTCT